jgi:Erv1 / Alr family
MMFRQSYQWNFVLALLCIYSCMKDDNDVTTTVSSVILVTATTASAADATEDEMPEDYLYHTEEAKGIIIDYEPPLVAAAASTKAAAAAGAKGNVEDRPDFLYGPNQGPRVVEFYAPWCPHVRFFVLFSLCRVFLFFFRCNANFCSSYPHTSNKCYHFRNHYIKFAQQVYTIMQEYGVSGPPIQFYAVSCTVHKQLCRQQGIKGYPKIRLFAENAQQNATKEVQYWKLHVFDVLDALQIHVKHLPVADTSAFDTITINDDTNSKSKMTETRTKRQMFNDAYLSFEFNMRNGIHVQDGPMSNKTKVALKAWLTLTKQTIPVVWELHAVVNALLNDFEQIVNSEDHLIQLLDQYPRPTKTWSPSCTKGVDGMGYTCGLWQLFHIISVGLVEYNLMITTNDDTVVSAMSIRTTDAAETIRNFVEHFFACDVCRYNFLLDYDNCAHDRCHRLSSTQLDTEQWIQFPLWLFETHNAVNVRLQQERLAKEHPSKNNKRDVSYNTDQMHVEWPSRDACPVCWLDSGGWNDEAVYKYLRTEYWSEDLISADYRAEVTKTFHEDSTDTFTMSYSQLFLHIIEWSIVIALVGLWYKNRLKLIRSGLHKKRDLDC